MKNTLKTTKALLINLYLSLKEKCMKEKEKNKKSEEEKDSLKSLEEATIIKYIKDLIDTKISILAEKKINEVTNKFVNKNIQEDYESMLIKYEKDLRGHIKTEHQLKLYAESLQNNIDELEKAKNESHCEDKDFKEIIKKKNDQMGVLNKEIKMNKQIIEEKDKIIIENEKKFNEAELKYKVEIEKLNKKIKYYENIFVEESLEKERKSNTIYCKSSRIPIKSHSINKNENVNNNNNNNNNKDENSTFRNMNTNNLIGNTNYSKSISSSYPYSKKDKYSANKYCRISNNHYKIKNMKGSSAENSIEKNNMSYIIDFKGQNESLNKLMTNNSSLNINSTNISKKNRKIYNRHKSIENTSKLIRNKPLGIIKKILLSNNERKANNNKDSNLYENNNHNKINSSNSLKNINSIKNNPMNNNNFINVKKIISNSTINNGHNFINGKSNTGYIFNNNNNPCHFFENKNNCGCNFVNNINIYSNNIKQNNIKNIYIGNNLKRISENHSTKNIISGNLYNFHNNYNNIDGKKNINFRNKQKDKLNSTYSNNA